MDANPPPPPEPEESFEPLPDTPESKRARKWLFRSLLLLALINVGLLTWVLLTGWLKPSAP